MDFIVNNIIANITVKVVMEVVQTTLMAANNSRRSRQWDMVAVVAMVLSRIIRVNLIRDMKVISSLQIMLNRQ